MSVGTAGSDRIKRYRVALEFAERQVAALGERHPDFFPIYTTQGRWQHGGELWTDWTGGFLAGRMRLGLLHGRLKPDEKDQTMRKFRMGEYDALVSTTVIEVGVDIPNASVMLIEGADRFGLAQLHQLRGRVGRGSAQSYCLLIPAREDSAEYERLRAMTESND